HRRERRGDGRSAVADQPVERTRPQRMTDPATRPIPVAAGPRIEGVPAADGEVLTRATGVELLGEVPGSGYRRPPSLARRGDGQVLQLSPLLNQVLLAVDGRRSVDEVAA